MASSREESALSDSTNFYQRNQGEYTYRLPAAPRIVVPPPTTTTGPPDLRLDHGSVKEVDLSFLDMIDLSSIIQKNTLLDWAYERRRQAQMILPWLYLGPMLAARDKVYMKTEGITMVLAIRTQANSMTGAIQAARDLGLEVVTIEVPGHSELISRFPETTRQINYHLAKVHQLSLQNTGQPFLAKVMVFCESGNEKSAAVVAAYMMEMLQDFNHVKAMHICQAQRFCVHFDDTLKNILRAYSDILQAKRSVATCNDMLQPNALLNGHAHSQTGTPPQAPTPPNQKRRIERTWDEDEMQVDELVDPSDALRFAGRDVTPFQDRGV